MYGFSAVGVHRIQPVYRLNSIHPESGATDASRRTGRFPRKIGPGLPIAIKNVLHLRNGETFGQEPGKDRLPKNQHQERFMEKEFHSRPAPLSPETDEHSFLRRRALELCDEALSLQRAGNLQKALTRYKASLKVTPTAEAHCFYGWALSQLGRLDLAIAECLKAIRLDPEFGNPYNDIGSYHVRKGMWRDAIEWFERAKRIPKYESPHFPFINLGRLYASQGASFRALREFRQALKFVPDDKSVRESVEKIEREILRGTPRAV